MDVYTTEEEQIAAIKKWWKDNYIAVAGGVLLGVGVLYGGNTWLNQQDSHAERASFEFETMIQNVGKDEKQQAEDRGALLLGQYSDTPYAALASLVMAKLKVDANDLVAAKPHLRWALDNAGQDEMKHIARLRLARVMLAEGNHNEAQGLISVSSKGNYEAAYAELNGDIQFAMGNENEARSAYSLALAKLEPSSQKKQYIDLKIDDLGENSMVQKAILLDSKADESKVTETKATETKATETKATENGAS